MYHNDASVQYQFAQQRGLLYGLWVPLPADSEDQVLPAADDARRDDILPAMLQLARQQGGGTDEAHCAALCRYFVPQGVSSGSAAVVVREALQRCFRRLLRLRRGRGYFLQNGLWVLDLWQALRWLGHSAAGRTSTAQLRVCWAQRDAQRALALRVCSLMHHAQNGVRKRPTALIRQLKSWPGWGLPSAQGWTHAAVRAELVPRPLHQLGIPPDLPQDVKAYLLDLAMCLSLADHMMQEEEQVLLTALAQRLELPQDDVCSAEIALEWFVIAHRERCRLAPHLRQKWPWQALQQRITLCLQQNMGAIVNEIRETSQLYQLLLKSTRTSLSDQEKRIVRAQLLDILKTVPALAIFALPGGSILLPLAIKLLPFKLLPSSFELSPPDSVT